MYEYSHIKVGNNRGPSPDRNEGTTNSQRPSFRGRNWSAIYLDLSVMDEKGFHIVDEAGRALPS